jgi:2-dehydro-3-deoxygalactonokinase
MMIKAGLAEASRQEARAQAIEGRPDVPEKILMQTPVSIILDWGTSSLRAALVSRSGDTLDSRETQSGGIQFVKDGAFETALMTAVGDWFSTHGPLPVFASGMITSRNGWVEVDYVDAPAGVPELAAGTRRLTLANGASITFLPGMRDPAAKPFPDVMRGEEAQIIGCGVEHDRTLVLPGTHSKWARVEKGRISGFQTYATGEIFSLLTKHSFIAKAQDSQPGSEPLWKAFDRGAQFAASDDPAADAFFSAIFSARTGILAGELRPEEIMDYVSGLVIGSEFRQARAAGWLKTGDTIGIVGNNVLNSRYGRIAPLFGLKIEASPADAAKRGVLMIAGQTTDI